MSVAEQTTALIATFPDRGDAEHFVDDLHRAGFTDQEIGVVTREPEREKEADHTVENTAAAGAITGGAFGALAGIAVAAGLIPGIGPVLAGGVLAGVLASAATGVAAGGLLGALIGLGIPEDEARRYEEELKAGRTLVVVQGQGGRLPEAIGILRHHEKAAEATPTGVSDW
jgi:uncharacterized membrane protein